jgi:hypothetical protein
MARGKARPQPYRPSGEKLEDRRRKLNDIPANLLEWLKPYVRAEGNVVPKKSIQTAMETAAAKAGIVEWPRNGLRTPSHRMSSRQCLLNIWRYAGRGFISGFRLTAARLIGVLGSEGLSCVSPFTIIFRG